MSEPSVETLFDEFATRYRRGEHPDARDYLARAGPERDDLVRMLDRFLESTPAREPTEEEVVLMQARLEQQPPLLLLRLRRALTRDAVVDALVGALGLDPAKREKVDGYYHRLETGLLEPGGVSSRVWSALGDFLHANAQALACLRVRPAFEQRPAYLREAQPRYLASWSEGADDDVEAPLLSRSAPARARTPEPDEVDKLFTAGGSG